jgi:heme/copper-type cytochrome/quinol oxidase subunit 4
MAKELPLTDEEKKARNQFLVFYLVCMVIVGWQVTHHKCAFPYEGYNNEGKVQLGSFLFAIILSPVYVASYIIIFFTSFLANTYI